MTDVPDQPDEDEAGQLDDGEDTAEDDVVDDVADDPA
jgi:hypothetical protein